MAYGSLVFPERDETCDSSRALPPAEHYVVVAWYDSPEQLAWSLKTGYANVRLGKRAGTWHIPPELAAARHVLLRTYLNRGELKMMRLKEKIPGYKVFTANDLRQSGYPGAAEGEIYAVFEVEQDPAFLDRQWDEAILLDLIEEFAARRSYREKPLGRQSPIPRVLSLREILKALKE